MVPARFAIAMIDAGWILRSEIIWAKSVSLSETDSGNCMPESVSDRPTGSHEKIFMFAKEGKYYYDQDAVREPLRDSSIKRINQPTFDRQTGGEKDYSQGENPNMSARKALESFASKHRQPNPEDPRITHGSYKNGHSGYFNSDGDLLANPNGRNLRNVWRINPEPSRIQHFAAYPKKLVQVILDLACPKRVCVKCGVPWGPRSERTDIIDPSSKGSRFDKGKTAENQVDMQMGERRIKIASGYVPGCECGAGFTPGIVLDPFAGSGTTLVVAKRMGFNYVGIELSEKYCEMVRRRLADEIVSLELFGT
jgi:DNA modification methylase